MPVRRFDTVLRSDGEGAAFFIEVPVEVVAVMGMPKRPRCRPR